MKKTIIAILVLFLCSSNTVYAHPGRTDSWGGHWNHSTGEYHLHNDGPVIIEVVGCIILLFLLLVCFVIYNWLKYWWEIERWKIKKIG